MSRLQQPTWLKTLLAKRGPPPKLYAWTPANLDPFPRRLSPSRQSSLDERIFILGVGNIGLLFATGLARHPNPAPITLVVHRKDLLSQWHQGQGLQLTQDGLTTRNKQFDIEWWTESRPERGPVREVADGGKLRNLLISTKTSAAMPEADRLRRYLDKSSSVVFAQNGMSKLWPPHGPLYVAGQYEPGGAPNFSACVINHGLFSTGPFQSTYKAPADASIGPVLVNPEFAPRGGFLSRQISTSPLLETRAVSSGQLWLLQLEKLVVNAIINPLTALLRCENGYIFSSRDPQHPLVRVQNQLLAEISAVLQAFVNHESNHNLIASCAERFHDGNLSNQKHGQQESLEIVKRDITHRFSPERLQEKLHALAIIVGKNRSSMLQDVEAGKKTEVGEFNGWIVDTAAFLGKAASDTATHQRLIELVEGGVVLDEGALAEQLLH